ncbi:hypothetical protein ACFSTD_15715 [Novosphingobium colocasiae]
MIEPAVHHVARGLAHRDDAGPAVDGGGAVAFAADALPGQRRADR